MRILRDKLAPVLFLLTIAVSACGDNGRSSATTSPTSNGGAGGTGVGGTGAGGTGVGGAGGSGAGGGAPITGSALCAEQPAAVPRQCSSISQWGITWTFDTEYPCGQFVNGDPWVTPSSAGGKVHIIEVTPAAADGKNGLMVNPVSSDAQAFDSDAPGYEAGLALGLPYDAGAGDSLVKAVSLAGGCDKSCLQTATVLTVLDAAPPATALRPAYFGDAASKRLYCTDSLSLSALPELASTPAIDAEAPSLEGVTEAIIRVQLNYFGSWAGEQIRPVDNVRLDDPYGPDISNNNVEAALRVLLQRPGDSAEARRAAVVALLQYGIDNDAIFRSGKAGWRADGGHGLGMKLPIALTALLLQDADMAARLQGAARSDFAESDQTHLNAQGKVIWGQDRCRYEDETGEIEYWFDLGPDPKTRTCLDPYLLIDGGAEPGGWYQGCCTSQALKGSALVVRLIPGLGAVWNDALALEYADRWVAEGASTQPDHCAPPEQDGGPDPANPGHCIPDPDLERCATFPDCDCQAGKQCGRFPDLHGTGADQGLHRSAFVDVMWSAFR
ncbi:hypothetical protein WME79_05205 [Sorangium sp. So ce726]|uniref:hypothetical protein n=1 Tax=Sorangium sp. So ce726 TaxID=3133319 RepID=UPI003F62E857